MWIIYNNKYVTVRLVHIARIVHSKWILLIRWNKTVLIKNQISSDAVVLFHQFVLLLYHKKENSNERITSTTSLPLTVVICDMYERKKTQKPRVLPCWYGCFSLFFILRGKMCPHVYLPIPDWIKDDFITITQTFSSCLFLFYVCIQWWIFRWAENYCHLVFFRWRIFRSVLLGQLPPPPIQSGHVARVNLMTSGGWVRI